MFWSVVDTYDDDDDQNIFNDLLSNSRVDSRNLGLATAYPPSYYSHLAMMMKNDEKNEDGEDDGTYNENLNKSLWIISLGADQGTTTISTTGVLAWFEDNSLLNFIFLRHSNQFMEDIKV